MPDKENTSVNKVIVSLDDQGHWCFLQQGNINVWYRGYLYNKEFSEVIKEIASRVNNDNEESYHDLSNYIRNINGHFALVIQSDDFTFISVDRIRSIPLLYYIKDSSITILDNPGEFVIGKELNEETRNIIGMSGFALGNNTLYKNLYSLQAGESIVINNSGELRNIRYYNYYPVPVHKEFDKLKNELATITLAIIKKTVESVNGRQIVVPLSAGLDSRLIVSALRHIGYENVKCFSYGLKNNHEVMAGNKIAGKLNYPWTYISLDVESQTKYFKSNKFNSFFKFADTCDAVPFVQDVAAIDSLVNSGFIDKDAVFINGQSGDFISGAHVPEKFFNSSNEGINEIEKHDMICDALVDKHYSLWGFLKTKERLTSLKEKLWKDINSGIDSITNPMAVYEYSEWQNRQCKYVIGGQRSYEFFNYEWRLPLWDVEYLDFWASVPYQYKSKQNLYRTMLYDENWGGVWEGYDFERKIVPKWIIPLRIIAKLLHLPFGKDKWHLFEKRYLSYWMDLLANYSIVDYKEIRNDNRNFRNSISWIVEYWLSIHGVNLNNKVLSG